MADRLASQHFPESTGWRDVPDSASIEWDDLLSSGPVPGRDEAEAAVRRSAG